MKKNNDKIDNYFDNNAIKLDNNNINDNSIFHKEKRNISEKTNLKILF